MDHIKKLFTKKKEQNYDIFIYVADFIYFS